MPVELCSYSPELFNVCCIVKYVLQTQSILTKSIPQTTLCVLVSFPIRLHDPQTPDSKIAGMWNGSSTSMFPHMHFSHEFLYYNQYSFLQLRFLFAIFPHPNRIPNRQFPISSHSWYKRVEELDFSSEKWPTHHFFGLSSLRFVSVLLST